ncbi:MAG: cyanophycinase [Chitinophagaceae bacterium]
MNFKFFFIICFLSANCVSSFSQKNYKQPQGNLFIIGGGNRSPALIQKLIQTANLGKKDYIVVLPMSTEEPDTGYYYIKIELEKACTNTIANLNFTADKTTNKKWVDSLKNAKLIFITGGDQSRFMKIVLHTPVYDAIHIAYNKGATIAGSSAGAAVMSKQMITGNQLLGDTSYHETFNKLIANNIELNEGLGLLDSVIVDMHFIVRSRYNRLISAIAKFTNFTGIGIDEGTAIIVHHKKIMVTGESQVVVFSQPEKLQINSNGFIKFSNMHFSIYTSGDSFYLK